MARRFAVGHGDVRTQRVTHSIECEIMDEGGRLVAKAASTCMALRGERAKGRWLHPH